MQWHPFAEKFPLLEGEEREALKTSIRQTNGIEEQPVLYRVVSGEKEGLDGRNRYVLCGELGIEPHMRQVDVADGDVKDFILRRNVHRRHMTRELRQQIVAELRQDGKSERQIAEAVGVSPATVHRDIEAGASNEAPARVKGRDGKTYPAQHGRAGAAGEGDVERRQQPPKPAAAPGGLPEAPVLDAVGHPVPEGLREVFATAARMKEVEARLKPIQDELDELARLPGAEQLQPGLASVQKGTDAAPRLVYQSRELDGLRRLLSRTRPYSVCPHCKGARTRGCKGCSGAGWVSELTWKDIDDAIKGRLS